MMPRRHKYPVTRVSMPRRRHQPGFRSIRPQLRTARCARLGPRCARLNIAKHRFPRLKKPVNKCVMASGLLELHRHAPKPSSTKNQVHATPTAFTLFEKVKQWSFWLKSAPKRLSHWEKKRFSDLVRSEFFIFGTAKGSSTQWWTMSGIS